MRYRKVSHSEPHGLLPHPCGSFMRKTKMIDFLIQHWQFVAFIAGMLAILVFAKLLLRETPLPYTKRDALVTDPELEFYQVLTETAGEDYAIFAMVRLADLIAVQSDTQKRQAWQNRINAKHIDFVLCDPESLEPQLAVELDDRSHQRADRVERDRFVNAALSAAELPLLRIKVQPEYDGDKLRQRIDKVLSRAA